METTEQQIDTPVTPPGAKVTFSPEQQEKIDSLIRDSMSRAAKKVREDNETLRAELETLKRESEQVKTVSEQTRAELLTAKKQSALLDAVSRVPFVNASQVLQLTENGVVWSDEHRTFVVQGKDGVLLGSDGKSPLPLSDFYSVWGEKNPHLVRGSVKPGVGSTQNNGEIERSVLDRAYLRTLFGKGSDSKKANDLGRQNPQEYKRLKGDARRLGLI
jgi:hypothetical protein